MLNANQLHPKLVGCATNLLSFMANDSASRLVMVGNHLSQALVIDGATTARVKSGMEREYAKYTFDIKMPATGRILRILKRYGTEAFGNKCPEILILFEDLEQKVNGNAVMGCVSITGYHTKHQNYGFKYDLVPHIMRSIAKGEVIQKDVVLCKSPNVDATKDWKYGIEANCVYMSIPQIIEDGFVVSESFARKMTTTSLGNRMVSWGKNRIPLNLYGDDKVYRPFPEIGMRIRPDGLIFACRELDPLLGVVDLSPEKLRIPSVVFDDCYYGPPGAEVYDIKVLQDLTLQQQQTPFGMDAQVRRYANAQSAFYNGIVEAWENFEREHRRHTHVSCSDELHRLLAQEGYPDNPNSVDRPVSRTYRATPLDEWTVDIKFVRKVVPTVGFKITDRHGGKGVICAVWEDWRMPKDKWGNVADCIMDGASTIKRMNFGRLYEHWTGATCRFIDSMVRDELTPQRVQHDLEYLIPEWRARYAVIAQIASTFEGKVQLLKQFYTIVSPNMTQVVDMVLNNKAAWEEHIAFLQKNPVEVIIPTDSANVGGEMIHALATAFPIPISPVVYTGASGNTCETKDPVLVGSKYIILLEKTGEDWAAVASAKRQHYGVPARLTNRDKHSSPWRRQPVRILGEAEIRLLCAVMSPKMVAALLELPNAPRAQRLIAERLLTAEFPTAIKEIITEEEMPRGESRALLFVRHLMECAGCRYTNA